MKLFRAEAVGRIKMIVPAFIRELSSKSAFDAPPSYLDERWYTSEPTSLGFYIRRNMCYMGSKSRIFVVEIPDYIVEHYCVLNLNGPASKHSHQWGTEYLLPRHWCVKRTQTTLIDILLSK